MAFITIRATSYLGRGYIVVPTSSVYVLFAFYSSECCIQLSNYLFHFITAKDVAAHVRVILYLLLLGHCLPSAAVVSYP